MASKLGINRLQNNLGNEVVGNLPWIQLVMKGKKIKMEQKQH